MVTASGSGWRRFHCCGKGGRGGCLVNARTHSSKMGLSLFAPARPQSEGPPFLVDVGTAGVGCLIQNFAGSPEGPVTEPAPSSSDSAEVFR